MPHYKDGTKARVGDVVRGHGYNVRDPDTGELAEITGIVTHVTPNADACNVQVQLVDGCDGVYSRTDDDGRVQTGALIRGRIEYGQADHFEKVT